MSELNYSSFEKTVYPYCSDTSKIKEHMVSKEYYGDTMHRDYFDKYILLAAGLAKEDIDLFIEGARSASNGLTPQMLSRYRSGKDINKGISNLYKSKDAITRTKEHFSKYLITTITRDGEKGILYDLWQIILHDESIPQAYREDFEYFYSTKTLSAFLANVFVFAITRPISVSIQALEEQEKAKPKLPPGLARAIRDVQIRGDTTLLLSEIKRITGLIDEMKANDPEHYSDEKLYRRLEYEGAMLWRQTSEYVDADSFEERIREKYERLGVFSYELDVQEIEYENKQDMRRRISRLNDKY